MQDQFVAISIKFKIQLRVFLILLIFVIFVICGHEY